nr:Chain D, Non-canonical peptide F3 [synthetic construct]
ALQHLMDKWMAM